MNKKKTNGEPELIRAYKVTNFHVKAEPAFTLNIDIESPELKRLLKKHCVSNAAFITAWNPYSKTLSSEENKARNSMLENELKLLSLKFIEGFGQDPLGKWAGEDGFLVLGISLEVSKKLGVQFDQNAIVCADSDALPNLILLI